MIGLKPASASAKLAHVDPNGTLLNACAATVRRGAG